MKGLMRVRTKGSCCPSVTGSVVVVIIYLFLFPHAYARPHEKSGTPDETIKAAKFTNGQQICIITGLVEMSYNSTLDKYVYQDIQDEEITNPNSNPESRNENRVLPKFTAGLYRKCECHRDDAFPITNLNASDNVWNRGSIGDIQEVVTTDDIQSNLCPLEAQTCAIVYSNEKTNDESIVQQSKTQCYIMTQKVALVRHLFPIILFWMGLLTMGLLATGNGRQAIHYLIIRVSEMCCCCLCCVTVCCCDDSYDPPFNYNVRETYNLALAQRMTEREARVLRRNGRHRWEIPGASRNRDPANPIGDIGYWWLISQHQWSHNDSSSNDNNNNNNNDNSYFGDDEEQGGNRINNTGIELLSTSIPPYTYPEIRRKNDTQELSFRTKIYSKTNEMGRSKSHSSHICDHHAGMKSDNNSNTQATISTEMESICDASSKGEHKSVKDGATNLIVDDQGSEISSVDGNDENDVVCAICFGAVQDGDKVGDLPHCDHVFHATCLKTWILRKNTCPMCLKPIAKPTSSSSSRYEQPPDESTGTGSSSTHSSI